MEKESKSKVNIALNKLTNYCKTNNYKGYDLYDSLNSRLFISPFNKSRVLGIAITQLIKRSPINLRPILLVPKGYNPKGLALFIKGLIYQGKIDEAKSLADKLIKLKSNRPYPCWGYNFPWQAKAFGVERWEPNMVTTVFVADALFDLYEATKNKTYLNLAIGTKEFLFKELVLEETKDTLCFRYIPKQSARVHNANLLGAMLLARIYSYTKEKNLKNLARKSINYSIKAQRKDGSWFYGEMPHHQWIDNFHTGFNLCAINKYQKYTQDKKFKQNIILGLKYHIKNHFLKDMTPKYYNNKLYPIDIHNYAQGIITMLEFGKIEKAKQLANKATKTMQDKKGYFYYQKQKYFTNKIPYIRWSQAWMFYALSKLARN